MEFNVDKCKVMHVGNSDNNSSTYYMEGRELAVASYDKNSSGDEIANVNFLRRYGTYVLQNTKKENLLRLTN